MQRCIICGHKFARVRKAGQGGPPKARTTEIEPRLAMTIGEGVNVGRQFQARSHSLPPLSSPWSSDALTVTVMLPALLISTRMRSKSTPAATIALTALVTSCCRNVEGARAMVRKSAYGSLEIVQAVTNRSERRLVVLAEDDDRAGRILNRGRRLGERHDFTALQQPDQAGLVVAG